ncbi:hypothetical protein GE21DRAFT_1000590 [Neurospora crassa]|nr:hypothetical protein GE21DRAFT_1000590 [Neurospora crassa]
MYNTTTTTPVLRQHPPSGVLMHLKSYYGIHVYNYNIEKEEREGQPRIWIAGAYTALATFLLFFTRRRDIDLVAISMASNSARWCTNYLVLLILTVLILFYLFSFLNPEHTRLRPQATVPVKCDHPTHSDEFIVTIIEFSTKR